MEQSLLERICGAFRYDPATGTLFKRRHGHEFACRAVDYKGYLRVVFEGKHYRGHRLIWFLVHGYWPEMVDHIDGNRLNNRIENLREANATLNARNRTRPAGRSKSGHVGVYIDKRTKRPYVQIKVDGKTKSFGVFNTVEEAARAYIAAKREVHPGSWVDVAGVQS